MNKPLSELTRAEQAAGRRHMYKNMCEGLIEQLAQDLGGRGITYRLVCEGPDFRYWGVRAEKEGIAFHSEDFAVFPSDELKAKVMLVG